MRFTAGSDRLHRLVRHGLADSARACAKRGILYHAYVEPAPGAGKSLLAVLAAHACILATDEFPWLLSFPPGCRGREENFRAPASRQSGRLAPAPCQRASVRPSFPFSALPAEGASRVGAVKISRCQRSSFLTATLDSPRAGNGPAGLRSVAIPVFHTLLGGGPSVPLTMLLATTETGCQMARYSAFLGRRVEVQYRAGDILLPASGTFVADSGRSIFLEQNFEQRGQHKHFRWEIPYQYVVRIEEKPDSGASANGASTTATPKASAELAQPAGKSGQEPLSAAAAASAGGAPDLLPHQPKTA